MMTAMRLGTVAALGLVLIVPALAPGQVYRWEDEQGTVYFTNSPDRIPEPQRPRIDPSALPPPPAADAVVPAALARSAAVTRIPFTPGDAILVSARIGGAGPLTLILDTGADRTMVAPTALFRLGIALVDGARAEVRGVTGTSQGGVVVVPSLEVGEARVGPLRIIALEADLKKADGLLGRDFLEHFTLTIDARERMVTLVPK
jgi:Aspartyl protease/Domain of unknown function (DUF4124)